jgi:hypothetical protein
MPNVIDLASPNYGEFYNIIKLRDFTSLIFRILGLVIKSLHDTSFCCSLILIFGGIILFFCFLLPFSFLFLDKLCKWGVGDVTITRTTKKNDVLGSWNVCIYITYIYNEYCQVLISRLISKFIYFQGNIAFSCVIQSLISYLNIKWSIR